MMTKRILIIDNSLDNCSILGIMLRKMGFLYITVAHMAKDGVEILQDFRSKGTHVDLLIQNIDLPDENGVELCRQMKSNRAFSSPPIIMLYAPADHERIEQAVQAGADDFVEKPLRYTELSLRIRILLKINNTDENNSPETNRLRLAPRISHFDTLLNQINNLVYKAKRSPRTGQISVTVNGGKLAERLEMNDDLFQSTILKSYFQDENLLTFREYHRQAFQGIHSTFELQHQGDWFLFTLSPILSNGLVGEVIGSVVDISEQKKREEVLRQSEENLRKLFDYTPVMICAMDATGVISDINTYFLGKMQYASSDMIGKKLIDFLTASSKETFIQSVIPELFKEKKVRDIELSIVTRKGQVMECLLNSKIMEDEEGNILRICTTIRDFTERKRNEERMQYMAYHDHLTQLPNRTLFYKNFNQALEEAKEKRNPLAVMLIDIDHFKSVNDTMGHRMGDMVLCAISKILTLQVGINDTVARLGGDEFVVLLHNIANDEEVVHRADRILSAFINSEELNFLNGLTTASIGISIYPKDGADTDTLIMKADRAMYRSKQNGRNGFQRHNEDTSLGEYSRNHRLSTEHSRRKMINA